MLTLVQCWPLVKVLTLFFELMQYATIPNQALNCSKFCDDSTENIRYSTQITGAHTEQDYCEGLISFYCCTQAITIGELTVTKKVVGSFRNEGLIKMQPEFQLS